MLKHGGRFENYFSRHRVIHIICSNLPDSKIKNLRSFSAGIPVVKPAWLLDSVAANKLLSWVPYELDQVASETHNQPKLSSFFALKSSALSNDPTTCVTGQVNSEIEDPSLIGGTIKESDLSGRCGYKEHLRPCSRESRDWDDSVHGISTSVKIGEATCNDGECSEGNVAEPIISDNANKSTSSAIAGPSKRHHSTLVDPNFVENYFKKSRLHFIVTWRSSYRKGFPSSIYTSSNVNASSQRTFVIHVDMVADQFYNILHKHCNKVQAVSCDEAFLEVRDFEVEDPQFLASVIRKEIVETTGCTASAGISGNLLMARLATKAAKPDGQCYIPPEKESLQKEFGVKTGDMLWNHNRGVDNRLVGVIQENKSVGAEVNWGVRFNDMKDVDVKDIRGMGLQVSKLESVDTAKQGITLAIVFFTLCVQTRFFWIVLSAPSDLSSIYLNFKLVFDLRFTGNERNSIRSWLSSASASTKEQLEISSPVKESASREIDEQHIDESMGQLSSDFMGPSVQIGTNPSNYESPLNHNLTLPALGDLDLGVVASLPPDLFSEINDIYDGKLMNLISKRKGKSVAQERVQVPLKEGSGTFYHHPACVNENRVVDKEEKYPLDKIQPGPSNMGISTEVSNKLDLMPSSLSQVDTSVLQQLPEELRVDILQLLPAHRQPECVSDVILDPSSKSKELLGLKSPENQPSVSGKELWAGNPPEWDDAIRCLCDLLKQYIKLRVETDIEEIYVSLRLLKRFTIKSKLFSQVYNVVFPQLQASVGENYGGRLHISDGKDQCF
ncbi:hypothetical protein RHGRI_013793 [Rhododendron griersonianum]|uniref:DNA repair protein REV1 n=1 Tax=Rhododendron griersonianum TaxID=479676 RepID=A0AAV6K6V7_9ERIC|nr:hypothetical protein RHGRI_013793 [Rhododendron griersonianum]